MFNSKFEEFMSEYGKFYDNRILKYIKINFHRHLNSNFTPDVLMQIYSYLGIRNDLVYTEHLDKIQRYFDIKCNILEVGCGYLPAFATLLSSRQLELGCGTVTAYDPKFPYDSLDFHIDYIVELAEYLVKEYDNGILCYDRVSDRFSDVDYPILYNKKS